MPTRRSEIEKRIINGALSLIAVEGWNATSLADIAKAAEVTLGQLQRHFAAKASIVTTYMQWVDADMLGGGGAEGDGPRERLFDIVMRRLDQLAAHKNAVRAIARDLPADPVTGFLLLCQIRKSLSWMLEAAGINSGGVRGEIRIKGLGLVYLATLRVWFRDDSDDMSKTMAELDRHLHRAEAIAKCLPEGRLRRRRENAEAA